MSPAINQRALYRTSQRRDLGLCGSSSPRSCWLGSESPSQSRRTPGHDGLHCVQDFRFNLVAPKVGDSLQRSRHVHPVLSASSTAVPRPPSCRLTGRSVGAHAPLRTRLALPCGRRSMSAGSDPLTHRCHTSTVPRPDERRSQSFFPPSSHKTCKAKRHGPERSLCGSRCRYAGGHGRSAE